MMETKVSDLFKEKGLTASHHIFDLFFRVFDEEQKEVGQFPWHDFNSEANRKEALQWFHAYGNKSNS